MFEILDIKPIRNRRKWLEQNLGGTWRYGGAFTSYWYCNDGRVVRRTAPPVDEWDNPQGFGQYWLDTPGKATVSFNWPLFYEGVPRCTS